MKYSDYFGMQIKNFGLPKLNKEQFQRMMNIAFVEGLIVGMSERGKNDTTYTWKHYRDKKSLNELTKRLPPEKLYFEMIKLSEKK